MGFFWKNEYPLLHKKRTDTLIEKAKTKKPLKIKLIADSMSHAGSANADTKTQARTTNKKREIFQLIRQITFLRNENAN